MVAPVPYPQGHDSLGFLAFNLSQFNGVAYSSLEGKYAFEVESQGNVTNLNVLLLFPNCMVMPLTGGLRLRISVVNTA